MSFGISAAAWGAIAVAGATAYSANKQSQAAKRAAQAGAESSEMGIEEQRRQFDAIQKLLAPYVEAGNKAIGQQGDLIGLNGNANQSAAIAAIENSPQFQSLVQQGENSILQNAAATGGLRGGNVQAALGQFRPSILSGLIQQQFDRLGGISSVGQNAAAGVGNAGMQTGANITNLFQQQGAAIAGGALAQGRAASTAANSVVNGLAVYQALGGKW